MMQWRGMWLALLLSSNFALSQGIGTWTNYTSMKNVSAVARHGSDYWAATDGGLFHWTAGSSSFQRLTNADGLLSQNLTSVAIDSEGTVWSGSYEGYVNVYNPSTSTLRIIRDIATSSQASKQVNTICVHGDSVLFGTAFGLCVFNKTRFEFGDTYTHFGSISQSTRLSVSSTLIANNYIYAAISDGAGIHGVASAPLDGTNLLSASSWKVDLFSSSDTVKQLATVGTWVYASTANGMYAYHNSAWTSVSVISGNSVKALAAHATGVFAATSGKTVYSIDTLGTITAIGSALPSVPMSLAIDASGQPAVGSAGSGILTLDTAWTSHFPNGPSSNSFWDVTVDANGIVWGASGPSYGAGIYRYDGTTWQSYTTSNSVLPSNDFYRITTSSSGSVWASSWGRGCVEFPNGRALLDSAHVYNSNVGMSGIATDLAYVPATAVASDSQGNNWMVIDEPADGNILVVRNASGTWRTLPVYYSSAKLYTPSAAVAVVDRILAVDGSDNLWMVSRDKSYSGIACLQNAGTIDSVAEVLLTTSDGLPSNEITTVVVDAENQIWLGTDDGIAIIVDPANPTRSGAVASYIPLEGTYINAIAVDPLNRKWIGTQEGVILLSADGTEELASYTFTSTNGKLLNNNIKSIAVDPSTGTVYFGTISGLASLKTVAAAGAKTAGDLTLYPNPFRVPASSPLVIDGLMSDSQIKVLASDGSLVRDLTSPGGRIGYWDGKDAHGNIAASGIYFIIGYTSGGEVCKGKVAVLRK